MGRKGKYEEWLTDDGLLLIEGWARDGLTDLQIAGKMGISERSLTDWKDRFPSVSSALKKGKAPVDREVENALLKRALGYDYEEITIDTDDIAGSCRTHTKKVIRHMPPDVTAQIFWLKNRRPDKWRDKQDISSTVEPVQIIWGKNED